MPEHWLAEAKLAVVIETATLSEIDLSQYCREKGLYPEQVNAWRQACLDGRVSATLPVAEKPRPTRSASASVKGFFNHLIANSKTPMQAVCAVMQ